MMSEFEEHIAQQKKYQDQMIAEAKAHDDIKKAEFEGLIDSLSADQLITLKSMLLASAMDAELAYQLTGVITGCIIYKYGRSWNGDPSPLADTGVAFVRAMHQSVGRPTSKLEEITANEEDKTAALMEEYNVVPDSKNDCFKCGNCGAFILNLEDRMILPPGPEGCAGCREKAKFG